MSSRGRKYGFDYGAFKEAKNEPKIRAEIRAIFNGENGIHTVVEHLNRLFPIGSRVELIRMDDVQAPPAGTQGTVVGVDDIGNIMVVWDNGSSLSVVYGVDICRKVMD